ncbi:MAG: hypothetical protein ACLR7D_10305 [Lachnospira eligens]
MVTDIMVYRLLPEDILTRMYQELSISECAVIASITKSPTGLNPIRHADRNKDRQSQVSPSQYERAGIYIPGRI